MRKRQAWKLERVQRRILETHVKVRGILLGGTQSHDACDLHSHRCRARRRVIPSLLVKIAREFAQLVVLCVAQHFANVVLTRGIRSCVRERLHRLSERLLATRSECGAQIVECAADIALGSSHGCPSGVDGETGANKSLNRALGVVLPRGFVTIFTFRLVFRLRS